MKAIRHLRAHLLGASGGNTNAARAVAEALLPWFEVAAGERPPLRAINTVEESGVAYAIGATVGREIDCLRQISARNGIGLGSLRGLKPFSAVLKPDLDSLRRSIGAEAWRDLESVITESFARDLEERFAAEYRPLLDDELWNMARESLIIPVVCASAAAIAGDMARTERFLLLLRATRGQIVLGEMSDRPGWWVLLAA